MHVGQTDISFCRLAQFRFSNVFVKILSVVLMSSSSENANQPKSKMNLISKFFYQRLGNFEKITLSCPRP